MIIDKRDAQRIVDEIKATVHRDVNFMNQDGIIIASTDPDRLHCVHEGARLLLQKGLSRFDVYESNEEQGVRKGINLAIHAEGKVEGVIGITGEPEELSDLGGVIQKMTEIMIIGLRHQVEAELLERAQRLLIENWLLDSELDPAELERRGNLLGIDCRRPRRVAVLKILDGAQVNKKLSVEIQNTRFLSVVRRKINFDPQNFCVILGNRIVILLARRPRREIENRLDTICREIYSFYGNSAYCGIGPESKFPPELGRSYSLARTACDIAIRNGRRPVCVYDDFSLPSLARCIPPAVAQELTEQIFARCANAEQQELLETVRLYFETEGNSERAAKRLYIHKNTFQYRIKKVEKKTGLSLRTPTEAVLLYLVMELSSKQE